ncbi:MAG: hypothetical protein JNL82_10920 [Myxococcales bacterium]|nr:hypothetical protein [Myxococcales bacterium]
MAERDDEAMATRGVGPVVVPGGPEGIARATATTGPSEVTSVTTAGETAAIAAALAGGAIDPAGAQAELIAATVAGMRPAGADPAVWAAIEADVVALLAGDPGLGDLLRR